MRTLIVANGTKPPDRLLKTLTDKCDFIIAADGGGNTALEAGVEPGVVIGDLDSFRYTNTYDGKIIRDSDQETNDLEKALQYAKKNNAARVDVLGATGGRLDQTLKNLSVLLQFDSVFGPLAFYDASFFIRILPRDYTVTLPENHLVSLFPVSGKVTGIVTEGLQYPLNNEALQNGIRDGSSNRTNAPTVRIRHRTGSLLFMAGLTGHLIE